MFWYSSISLGKCFESSSTRSDLKFCLNGEKVIIIYFNSGTQQNKHMVLVNAYNAVHGSFVENKQTQR